MSELDKAISALSDSTASFAASSSASQTVSSSVSRSHSSNMRLAVLTSIGVRHTCADTDEQKVSTKAIIKVPVFFGLLVMFDFDSWFNLA